MHRFRYIVLVLLALCLYFPASAQWKGSVSAEGSWNFRRSWSEKSEFKLNYDAGKTFYSSFDFTHTASQSAYDVLDLYTDKRSGKNEASFKLSYARPAKRDIKTNLLLGFRPSEKDDISLKVHYGSGRQMDTTNIVYLKVTDDDLEGLAPVSLVPTGAIEAKPGSQQNISRTLYGGVDATMKWAHKFKKKGRKLNAFFTAEYKPDSKSEHRIIQGSYFARDLDYYLYPYSNGNNMKSGLSYEDPDFLGIRGLKGSAGANLTVRYLLDHYGGGSMDPETWQWRDSTRITFNYIYEAVAVDPFLRLSYSLPAIDFNLNFTPSYCGEEIRFLKEDDDGRDIIDDFDFNISVGSTWKIADGQKLNFYYRRFMTRPDYKKLTSVISVGSSESEYYIGNPNLVPFATDSLKIGYSLNLGAFEVKPSIAYEYMSNKFEKVVYLLSEEERARLGSGAENVTVYTWVNAARQWAHHYEIVAKWNGARFKADLTGRLNQNVFEYLESDSSKSMDWRVSGGASYKFPLDFTLSAKASYQSELRTAYSRYDDYVNVSLKLLKAFRHGISLFVEGRDLFDDDLVIETMTPTLDYSNTRSSSYYRRAVAVGMKWDF